METFEHITNALADAFLAQSRYREHDLIQHCKTHDLSPLNALNLSQSLELFKAHFIVRHCLYQLQNRWQDANCYKLHIDLIEIQRQPFTHGVDAIEPYNYLRDYYLDLDNLENTSEAEVNLLLSGFWNYVNHAAKRSRSLKLLGLNEGASYLEIKRKFRALAQQMHPDKGGSADAFQDLVAAKNTLDALKRI